MENQNYSTLEKNGEVYVLRTRRRITTFSDANFMGTGLALSGILERGQNLKAWIEKRNNIPVLSDARFRNLKYGRRAKLNAN